MTKYSLVIHVNIVGSTQVQYILNKKKKKKKKRNSRLPRIFEFKSKTVIISGLLLYDSHSWDIKVYHAKS